MVIVLVVAKIVPAYGSGNDGTYGSVYYCGRSCGCSCDSGYSYDCDDGYTYGCCMVVFKFTVVVVILIRVMQLMVIVI